MGTPGEIPKAKPIVTEHLLREGPAVKLDDKTAAIDHELERAYVRSRTSADKAKLKTNYEGWLKDNADKAEAVPVRQLLESLKADIEAPDAGMKAQPAVALDKAENTVTSLVEHTVGNAATGTLDGLKKIPEYARDEAKRFMEADTTERKIGIVGKNALLLGTGYGLFRLYNWMTSGIDKSAEKAGAMHYVWQALKWTGALALTGWGAKMLLGKDSLAALRPTTAPPKPKITVDSKEAAEDGKNLVTPFMEAGRTIDIKLDDGTVVSILDPVNEKEKKLQARIRIGDETYELKPNVKGTPLDYDPEGKEKPIDEVPLEERKDPKWKLDFLARAAKVEKQGSNLVATWPNLLPPGTNTLVIDLGEFTKASTRIRAGLPQVELQAKHVLTNVLSQTTETPLRLPVGVTKVPKAP